MSAGGWLRGDPSRSAAAAGALPRSSRRPTSAVGAPAGGGRSYAEGYAERRGVDRDRARVLTLCLVLGGSGGRPKTLIPDRPREVLHTKPNSLMELAATRCGDSRRHRRRCQLPAAIGQDGGRKPPAVAPLMNSRPCGRGGLHLLLAQWALLGVGGLVPGRAPCGHPLLACGALWSTLCLGSTAGVGGASPASPALPCPPVCGREERCPASSRFLCEPPQNLRCPSPGYRKGQWGHWGALPWTPLEGVS